MAPFSEDWTEIENVSMEVQPEPESTLTEIEVDRLPGIGMKNQEKARLRPPTSEKISAVCSIVASGHFWLGYDLSKGSPLESLDINTKGPKRK